MTKGQARVKNANTARVGEHHLTTRQVRYLTARARGLTKQASKIETGYTPNVSTCVIERGGGIKKGLRSALEAAGLTDDFLAKKIAEGVKATKLQYFTANGKVSDKRSTPDYDARHKFTKTALEIRGDLQSEGVNLQLGIVQVGTEKSVEDWGKEVAAPTGTDQINPSLT